MEKTKWFEYARFSAEILNEAIELFWKEAKIKQEVMSIEIEVNGEKWKHDELNEFWADYRKSDFGEFNVDIIKNPFRLIISGVSHSTRVVVRAPTRAMVETVFSVFERNLKASLKPPPASPSAPPPVIFIGHGGNIAWRDLKDHLQDKHGYQVEAYETGARAGHAIRDILDQMASRSAIAFLVYTAEDEQKDGSFRARQNVIHETGLFQGRLGFARAIALIQDGVDPFSNLQGIDQIRFTNIKETFGDVLATIKRETAVGTEQADEVK